MIPPRVSRGSISAALLVTECVGIIVGLFAVRVTGEYPERIRDFLAGAFRYALRFEPALASSPIDARRSASRLERDIADVRVGVDPILSTAAGPTPDRDGVPIRPIWAVRIDKRSTHGGQSTPGVGTYPPSLGLVGTAF